MRIVKIIVGYSLLLSRQRSPRSSWTFPGLADNRLVDQQCFSWAPLDRRQRLVYWWPMQCWFPFAVCTVRPRGHSESDVKWMIVVGRTMNALCKKCIAKQILTSPKLLSNSFKCFGPPSTWLGAWPLDGNGVITSRGCPPWVVVSVWVLEYKYLAVVGSPGYTYDGPLSTGG